MNFPSLYWQNHSVKRPSVRNRRKPTGDPGSSHYLILILIMLRSGKTHPTLQSGFYIHPGSLQITVLLRTQTGNNNGISTMGKTGTTKWSQIKNVAGQIRLVPAKEEAYKKPGPNQRFKSGNTLKKAIKKTQDDSRGGRGRGRRQSTPQVDPRFRRRIKRSQTSIKGSK